MLNYTEVIAVVPTKIALGCGFNFQTGKSSYKECGYIWNTLDKRTG